MASKKTDTDSGKNEKKLFVLENVPSSCNKDYIINYIEVTIDVDVEDVVQLQAVPSRALVILKKDLEDFADAAKQVEVSPIGSEKVKATLVRTSRKKTAVVVEKFDKDKLSEEFLHLYLEITFADGKPVVTSSQSFLAHEMAVVSFEESCHKDSRKARTKNGTELYLILTRMLLGNVFLCDDQHPTVANRGAANLTRPPCVHCLQDKCTCKNQTLFDSVMGDGRWLFREFVVYQMNQCYPEYIIKYKRV